MLSAAELQPAIDAHHAYRPEDRTFKIQTDAGVTLWVKTPSQPRFRWIYTFSNNLVKWLGMPYFQAPPHAGAPGGAQSLQIEKQMLIRLNQANVPVPQIVASTPQWLALSTTGEKNLDEILNDLPVEKRATLWQQAVQTISDAHQKGLYFSQAFARNIMLEENGTDASSDKTYQIYFLDFEEDPGVVMSTAQAQMRDWAFFLHSTACLVTHDMPAAERFFLEYLRRETPEAQKTAKRLFKQLSRLRTIFKHIRNTGRDCERLYQLGIFASGITEELGTAK